VEIAPAGSPRWACFPLLSARTDPGHRTGPSSVAELFEGRHFGTAAAHGPGPTPVRVGRRGPRPRHRELLALGLTVEDLRGIAVRIQLLVEDPQRRCADDDPAARGSSVVARRLAAIDAEIAPLTGLRTRLARQTVRALVGVFDPWP
jgi:hypothetical protein